MLHELVDNPDDPRLKNLSGEQLWAVRQAELLTDKAVRDAGLSPKSHSLREVRLWARDETFTPIFSGQFDRLYLDDPETPNVGLFVDYKFGRKAVEPAPTNLQLLAYAILGKLNYGMDTIYSALIQPRREYDSRYSFARYSAENIAADFDFIKERLRLASVEQSSPLRPGKWCFYCSALHLCAASFSHHTTIKP